MADAAAAGRVEETIRVRDGESVDTNALRRWIGRELPELLPAGADVTVRQYPAGFSNLTYLVQIGAEHGTRALVLRRPPRGIKPGVAHDMAREHGILTALHPLGVPVPRPIARCDVTGVIGAPFYLMEHVGGTIVRGNQPAALLALGEAMPDTLRRMSDTFVRTLVGLHQVPVTDEPLRALGRPGNYVERQVQGWVRRWDAARTESVASIESVARWLVDNLPPEGDTTLVHNDFKFDNLVLDPSLANVRAILDWEMATLGDPLMDLGTSLAYWVEAGDAPVLRALGLGATALPGSATRADIARVYGELSGRDVSDVGYYYAFGLFKVAVIAQQIYARHVAGLTADPRFGTLGVVVAALGDAAERCTRTRSL